MNFHSQLLIGFRRGKRAGRRCSLRAFNWYCAKTDKTLITLGMFFFLLVLQKEPEYLSQ